MTRKEMMQTALDSGKYQNRAQVRTAYQSAKNAVRNNNPQWKTGFVRTTARDWITTTPEPAKATIAPSAVTLATHPELFKPVNVPEVEVNPVDAFEWTDADTTALDNTIAELGLPEVPRLSNEDIAKQVIAGKWGNGADRVKRLTDAGYDYNTIRSIINRSMPKKVIPTNTSSTPTNPSWARWYPGLDPQFQKFYPVIEKPIVQPAQTSTPQPTTKSENHTYSYYPGLDEQYRQMYPGLEQRVDVPVIKQPAATTSKSTTSVNIPIAQEQPVQSIWYPGLTLPFHKKGGSLKRIK